MSFPVLQARKLIKELQAQLAAAEAAAVLTSCMSRRPCGSNALKSAIAKAEAAAPAVSGTATTTTMAGSSSASGAALGAASASAAGGSAAASSSCVFSELLVVRLQAAKKRLEVERAAEVLHKAAVTYKNVADLPKLETAVLNARKVGLKYPHTIVARWCCGSVAWHARLGCIAVVQLAQLWWWVVAVTEDADHVSSLVHVCRRLAHVCRRHPSTPCIGRHLHDSPPPLSVALSNIQRFERA